MKRHQRQRNKLAIAGSTPEPDPMAADGRIVKGERLLKCENSLRIVRRTWPGRYREIPGTIVNNPARPEIIRARPDPRGMIWTS